MSQAHQDQPDYDQHLDQKKGDTDHSGRISTHLYRLPYSTPYTPSGRKTIPNSTEKFEGDTWSCAMLAPLNMLTSVVVDLRKVQSISDPEELIRMLTGEGDHCGEDGPNFVFYVIIDGLIFACDNANEATTRRQHAELTSAWTASSENR